MAIYPTINKLPLDITGKATENRIVGEKHKITAINGNGFNFFIPEYAPFFADKNSFLIYDEDEGRYLNEGIDFFYTHLFTHAVGEVDEHKAVFGSVTFINQNFNNNITIQYNALGGDWSLNQYSIYEIIANRLINPYTEHWENIVGKPLKFPVKDHNHDIQTDFTGFETLLAVLNKYIEILQESNDQPDLTEIYRSFRDLIANSIKLPLTITGETTNQNDGAGHTHKIDHASYTSYGITKFADKASDKDEYIGLTVTSSLLYKHAFFRDKKVTLADDLDDKYLNRVYGAYSYIGNDRTISSGYTVNRNGNHPSIIYDDETYLGINGILFILPHIDGSLQYLILDNGAIFLRHYVNNQKTKWIMLAAAGGSTDVNQFFEIVNQLTEDVKEVNERINEISKTSNEYVTKNDIQTITNNINDINENIINIDDSISKLKSAYIFKDELVTGQIHIGKMEYLNPTIVNDVIDFTDSIGYRRYMNSNTDVINAHPDFTKEKNNTACTTINGIIYTYPANNCLQEQIITDNGYIYFRIRNYNNLYSPTNWICISWPSIDTINDLKETIDDVSQKVLNISSNLDSYIDQYMNNNYEKIINDITGKIVIPTIDYAENYLFDIDDFISEGDVPTDSEIEEYKNTHLSEVLTIKVANQLEDIINKSFVPFKGNLNQADLNDLKGKQYGEYYQNLNEWALESLHYPKEDSENGNYSSAGALKVIQNHAHSDDSCTQLYYPYKSIKIFIRYFDADINTWSEWKVIGVDESDDKDNIQYIYPNGTEDSPYKVSINDEFILKDEYKNKSVLYIPEVKYLCKDDIVRWVSIGYEYTNLESSGINVERTSDGCIAIKTGNRAIISSDENMTRLPNLYTPSDDITSAEFRIAIYFPTISTSNSNHSENKDGNNKTENNKISNLYIGEFKLFPYRITELPYGWYFRNGDNFLLDSPQGQVLNNLSDYYKLDHNITIKVINEKKYINLPNAFNSNGIGYFERAVNGVNRQVGNIQSDSSRRITGTIASNVGDPHSAFLGDKLIATGAFKLVSPNTKYAIADNFDVSGAVELSGAESLMFDSGNSTNVSDENRPINIGLTPAIYLGV